MTEYRNMWELMSKYSFKSMFDQQQSVICKICMNLLIDSYQGDCGCQYCRRCIETYARDVNQGCPGYCKNSKMEKINIGDNIYKNENADVTVSNLNVNCPCATCSYNAKLINMFDHWRVCDKRPVFCPYREMGCTLTDIPNDRLVDHLQASLGEHSQWLIEWIINIKNEMSFLSDNRNRDNKRTKIENALQILNDQLSERIFEINKDKEKNQELIRQLQDQIIALQDSSSRSVQLIEDMRKINIRNGMEMQKVCHALRNEMKMMKIELEIKYESNSKKENRFDGLCKSMYDIDNLSINQSVESLKKCSPLIKDAEVVFSNFASFSWEIDKFNKLMKNRGEISSEYFYSTNRKYQMQLWIYPDESDRITGASCMSIKFCVCDGPDVAGSKLSLQSDVTVLIMDESNPAIYQTVSRPVSIFCGASEIFQVLYSDLAGVIQRNAIIIKCLVDVL